MRTYQTLSLIGCILGMLLTIGLFMTEAFLIGFSGNIANSPTLGSPQLQEQQTQFEQEIAGFMAGLALAFIAYIILLILTFVVKKNVKGLGVTLLVVGFLAVLATFGWGIISYALLIPAGYLAIKEGRIKHEELKEKKQSAAADGRKENNNKKYDTGEEESEN